MEIGAQLFSLRNFIKNGQDIDSTFGKIKEMGYTCVQFSGATFEPYELKDIIDKYNLPVYLTHVDATRISEDTENVIKEHKIIGCQNIGLGAMPHAFPFMGDIEEVDEFVKKFSTAAQKIKDAGLKFFYHNHDFEFRKLKNGQTIFDYLVENAPDFNFTLDTYWVQRGGVALLEYIEKLSGRIECVHLKDMQTVKEGGQKFAPVGVGVINWGAVLPAFIKSGTKYAFVEQDDAVDYPDPFAQLGKSADNLKKMGYIK